MFIPSEVRPSTIFGKGLFPLRAVKKGTIVCLFTQDGQVITESEFVEAVRRDIYLILRTGTRYAGRYFTHLKDDAANLNFINHSFDPNLLCHCGVVIARRDIPAEEELTLDYRYLVDSTDVGIYNDAQTGEPIRGFSARETMLRTAKEMIAILESVEKGWEG
ncbi:MAG TPA: SET domain-containing protein [Tepidisphaeraceae bacterium]|jgi:hypothetical protein